MSCCGSCAAGGPCEPSRPTFPTYLAVCADPSMVFTRDAVGRQICARPGSGSMSTDTQRPTYVASCLPGYRWEDTANGPVCIPEQKPIPNTTGPQLSAAAYRPAVEFAAAIAGTAALRNCAPLPYTAASANAIAQIVRGRALANHLDPERLTLLALFELYPVTRENVPIDWGHLPASAAVCLLELRRLVRAKVDQVLAELALQAAQQRYRAAAAGGVG